MKKLIRIVCLVTTLALLFTTIALAQGEERSANQKDAINESALSDFWDMLDEAGYDRLPTGNEIVPDECGDDHAILYFSYKRGFSLPILSVLQEP